MGARHAIVSGTPRRCCLEIFITLLVGMTSPTPLQLKIYHSGTRRGLSGSMSYFENSFILTWRLGRIGNSRSQKKVLRLVLPILQPSTSPSETHTLLVLYFRRPPKHQHLSPHRLTTIILLTTTTKTSKASTTTSIIIMILISAPNSPSPSIRPSRALPPPTPQ